MQIKNQIQITVAGKAGQGVLSMGSIIEEYFYNMGLYTFNWKDYASLIKGGPNASMIRVSDEKVKNADQKINILIALDKDSIELHKHNLVTNSILIYNSVVVKESFLSKPNFKQKFYPVGIPLSELSKNIEKTNFYINTIGIGALLSVLKLDISFMNTILTQKYKKKSEKILDNNLRALADGYNFIKDNYSKVPKIFHPKLKNDINHILLTGSDAIALGAVKAGVSFVSAYPMTPATPTFEALNKLSEKHNILCLQAEDEISAVNMTIGASYSGVRSMTMTSGGGFSLMTETIGFSGMSETPLVVLNAMRGGPSTGLPTKTEQSDLRFVLHSSQGEFPRLVVAPGDSEEAFYHTQRAFNLAEKYQLPVIILSDEYLSNSKMIFEDFELDKIFVERGLIIKSAKELGTDEYRRYELAKDGVSPRVLPGTVGLITGSTSDEHNQLSQICEDPDNRIEQMNKRMSKEKSILPEIPKPIIYGKDITDITIICWGSNKNVCIEAGRILEEQEISINVIHFIYLYPLDERKLLPILEKLNKVVIVENNFTGQFAGLLKEKIGFLADEHLLKYNGEPFYPEEIVRFINKKLL